MPVVSTRGLVSGVSACSSCSRRRSYCGGSLSASPSDSQRLVVLEADVAAGQLEEHAAGLAEVDGVEVLAVDDLGRAGAGLDGLRADRLELGVVGGRPRDVVDRAGAGDAAARRRGVVAQRRVALGAAQRPVGAAVVGEADRLQQRGARVGARGVGAHAVEAQQRVLGGDVAARGRPAARRRRRPRAARGAGPRSRRSASAPSSVRSVATSASARRAAQKSSASSDATRHWMVWTMPSPAWPSAAPGNSKKVRIEPGVPRSSPKYRW